MVIRKIFLCICTLVITITQAFPQIVELRGKIVDKETKAPLSYCSILNLSNKESTITNALGFFRLDKVHKLDTIRVSMVGFEQAHIAVSSLNDPNNVIELTPKVTTLDEVVVRSVNFKNYIPKIYRKISSHFYDRYPAFEGIYRKQLVEDGRYVFLGECDVFCRGVKKQSNSVKVAIGQARATVNNAHNAKKVYLTLYSNLILYPYFHFISDAPPHNIEWKLIGNQIGEDQSSEVITLAYRQTVEGRLVEEGTVQVNTEDDAILCVVRHLYPKDNFIASLKDYQLLENRMTILYKYAKSEGDKYALTYSRSEWSFKFSETKDEIRQYRLINDLLITNHRSTQGGINMNPSIDPFQVVKGLKTVEASELRHLLPEYNIE